MDRYIVYTIEILTTKLKSDLNGYLSDKAQLTNNMLNCKNTIQPFFNITTHNNIYTQLRKKYDISTINIVGQVSYNLPYTFSINFNQIKSGNIRYKAELDKNFHIFLQRIKTPGFHHLLYASYDFYHNSNFYPLTPVLVEKLYQIINSYMYKIKQHFNWVNIVELYWTSNIIQLSVIPFVETTNKKFLLSRLGIVELFAINDYLNNPIEFEACWNKSLPLLTNHKSNSIYSTITKNEPLSKHLCMLSTNAGFYVTDKKNSFDIFKQWVKYYTDCIKNTDGFLRCDTIYEMQNIVSSKLQIKNKPGLSIDVRKDFYTLFSGKKILFVSPFANLINKQITSGNIKKLFKNKTIPEFELKTISIPITIFGNPVDDSWVDTYEKIKDKIKSVIVDFKADIFMASCGCYGLPLCNYVYTTYNISSIYYGNIVHQLFGLYQNSSDISLDEINKECWIEINNQTIICNYENFKKIDDGRYIKS